MKVTNRHLKSLMSTYPNKTKSGFKYNYTNNNLSIEQEACKKMGELDSSINSVREKIENLEATMNNLSDRKQVLPKTQRFSERDVVQKSQQTQRFSERDVVQKSQQTVQNFQRDSTSQITQQRDSVPISRRHTQRNHTERLSHKYDYLFDNSKGRPSISSERQSHNRHFDRRSPSIEEDTQRNSSNFFSYKKQLVSILRISIVILE